MRDLLHRHSSRLEFSLRVTDVIALWGAGQLSSLMAFHSTLSGVAPVHIILLYFGCGLAFLLFSQFEMYGSWRGRSMPSMFAHVAAAWAVVLTLSLLFSFLIHHVGYLSRLWMSYWYITGILFLIISRGLAYSVLRALRSKGLNGKRVIIVGYGQTGRDMFRRASEQSWDGYDVRAILAGFDVDSLPPGVDRIDSMQGIHDYVVTHHIHEIWITLPLSAYAELQTLQTLLRNALVDIRWVPDTASMQILSNKVISFLGVPAVDLNQPGPADVRGMVKEIFDKVFAFTALVLLAPLFLVIALLIKRSSPGPVFFKQPRLGLNGRQFNVYKFRSMRVHDDKEVKQATQNDPRVTPIGAFLRRTSLDELPQFFNVLMGDMSVVGPRPHALQHNEIYKDKLEMYMLRHRVKPGITGWAQIHGYRGETDTVDKMAKRVQFDLHYIQNWTFWMDLKIIAWTAFKGWTGNNAY